MIDTNKEKLITAEQAAAIAGNSGRGGTRPNKATIYRWMQSGYRGIPLESEKRPGGLRTSREAVHVLLSTSRGGGERRPDRFRRRGYKSPSRRRPGSLDGDRRPTCGGQFALRRSPLAAPRKAGLTPESGRYGPQGIENPIEF